jgi:hypothetical protein
MSENDSKKVDKKKPAKTVKKLGKKVVKKPAKKAGKKVVAQKAPEEVVSTDKPVEATTGLVLDAVSAELEGYEPEPNISGAPKNFVIRCARCRWARLSSGLSMDTADLKEVKANCKGCGKWRKFYCPKCSTPSIMKRFKGNA